MPDNIRLAGHIRTVLESILQDWDAFAKTILHAKHMSQDGLRDHARGILLAIADDLDSGQSPSEQVAKSKGLGPSNRTESWAEVHGSDRQTCGFSIIETVSEFRALRASVVSNWTKACPSLDGEQIEDLTRFHEAIDQAVAESLDRYTTVKEMQTRLFGAILLASPDPIYVLDPAGRFIYANKATSELFALSHEHIIGKSTFDLDFPFAMDFQIKLEQAMADQTCFRGRFVHQFASGQGERFEYLLAPVLNENQETEATVCIVRDITEQSLAEEKIWHNAHYDLLTGLPNRRLFLDRLEQEVKRAKRSNKSLAVLFMDLDGFKQVNDTLGHEMGDRLLASVSERLTACVRQADTIARLGGDEFTAILSGARQRKDVELVVKTIHQALALPFVIGEQPIRIAASIGVALYPQDATYPSALLQAADQAMYQAKKDKDDRRHINLKTQSQH